MGSCILGIKASSYGQALGNKEMESMGMGREE